MRRPAFASLRSIADDLRAHRNAYIMSLLASMGGLMFGWDTGLIGGCLSMSSFKRSFALEDRSKSSYANLSGNIVSTLQAGCFFGALFSIGTMTWIGRKWSMALAVVIFLIGSIIQTCSGLGSTSLTPLYVGRAVGGFGVGLISAVVPTFISESAPRAVRGRCTSTYQWLNVTGIMLSYWINYGLSIHKATYDPSMWRTSFALQIIPGLLCGVGLLFQHESPRWLVENDRIDEARVALAWTHRADINDPVVNATLEEIKLDYRLRPKLSPMQQLRVICSSGVMFYRSSIGCIAMFFQQFTGTNSINYYTPQIFTSLGLTNSGLFATGVYGVVKVVATGLALATAIEQAGRKCTLIYGGSGQAAAMWWIGIYQAIHGSGPRDGWSYTAIVAVYLYAVFYSFGWGSTPWAVASEMSPNQLRPTLMGFALMTQWLFNFVIARITPPMLANIPHGGTFMFFGGMLMLMVIWAMFLLPESRGVPLEEIGDLFSGGFRGVVKTSIQHLRHPPHARSDASLVHHIAHVGGDAAPAPDKSATPKGEQAESVSEDRETVRHKGDASADELSIER